MSQLTNIKNITYSTAFETDKVCATLVGSYDATTYSSVLGGFLYQYVIPHFFTRPVLCEALFSSDGSTYVPNGQSNLTTASQIYSDSSNIYLLSLYNTGTIFYKIICTWIDNYDTSNPLVSPIFQGLTNTTFFDSRQNYQKILINQEVTYPNPGTGVTGISTVFHDLGVTPNYKLFFESLPGQVWPAISGGVSDSWLYAPNNQYEIYGVVDNLNLTLTYNGGSASASTFRTWQKVYYDS